MKAQYKPGQRVYFLISGRIITQASVVSASSGFVTIKFRKNDDNCVIRLPRGRIFPSEREAERHLAPCPPAPKPAPIVGINDSKEHVCTRRWELW